MLCVRVVHAKPWPKVGPIRLRTANPFALASALRLAMRRAGAEERSIERRVERVLASPDGPHRRELCRPWVEIRH